MQAFIFTTQTVLIYIEINLIYQFSTILSSPSIPLTSINLHYAQFFCFSPTVCNSMVKWVACVNRSKFVLINIICSLFMISNRIKKHANIPGTWVWWDSKSIYVRQTQLLQLCFALLFLKKWQITTAGAYYNYATIL